MANLSREKQRVTVTKTTSIFDSIWRAVPLSQHSKYTALSKRINVVTLAKMKSKAKKRKAERIEIGGKASKNEQKMM